MATQILNRHSTMPNIYGLIVAYMRNTFPDDCHRKAMRAFDCSGSALPEAMRLDLFQELAANEHCDAHETRIICLFLFCLNFKNETRTNETRLQFSSIIAMTKAIYAEG